MMVKIQARMKIVTAFYDIGRGGWGAFGRSTKDYIRSFMNYTRLGYDVIAFIDDRIDTSGWRGCTVVPINERWLMEKTVSWPKIGRARAIMSSDGYRRMVGQRIDRQYPENVHPEYNMINHCKTDFLRIATCMVHDHDDMIAWSDFGYFHAVLHNDPSVFPTRPIDSTKLAADRMNFFLVHPPPISVDNILRIVVEAPEIFTGSFFAGPARILSGEFFHLYQECLDELHSMGTTDDDQTIYLMCYLRRPDLFVLHGMNGSWPRALYDLQVAVSDDAATTDNQQGADHQ